MKWLHVTVPGAVSIFRVLCPTMYLWTVVVPCQGLQRFAFVDITSSKSAYPLHSYLVVITKSR